MRLIDGLALYKEFMEAFKRHKIPEEPGPERYRAIVWTTEAEFFITTLNKAPTIEAEPVRHGQWIWRGNDKGWFCSECESGCLLNCESDWHKSDWCPHCGCRMDLE